MSQAANKPNIGEMYLGIRKQKRKEGQRPAPSPPKNLDEYLERRKASKLLLVPNHPERPQIVSDRPLPQQTRGGARKWDHFYPFEDMKPGDSFWVPSQTQCTAGAVTKFAKRTGWKFVTRGQHEDGKPNSGGRDSLKGTRVWRVK